MIKVKRSKRKHPIYSCFEDWLESCKDRGLRLATIETYSDKVQMFMEYVGNIDVEDLTDDFVYDFSYFLKECRNFNAISTNTYYRCINVFLTYLHEEYDIPLFHLEYLKETRRIKQIYTDEDIKKLTRQPNLDTVSYSELRTWLATLIALNTGSRASSICSIRKEDIDLKNRTILFRHAKNGKEYRMYVPRHVVDAIKLYLDVVDIEDYMFLNRDGGQLNSRQLGSSFRKYCKNRNVKTSSSIHVCRHWFASKLLLETKNAHLVSKALCHANLQTTEKYLSSLGLDTYSKTLESIDLTKSIR